jgi:ketosteroid isomerase-like protein
MTMTSASAESQVRARLEAWAEATRAGDLDAIMANYAPDVRGFDAIGPLQFANAQTYREHWKACLSQMRGPMKFEMHELEVTAQGDLAFCHYLARCGGTGPDHVDHEGWTRVTVCLRKTNGAWLVVHEHFSAPFDPESGKASFNLKPDSVAQTRAA